ncbi:hypothetical protein BDV93DRAFT_557076 [Ceratobasidium sp. AG-I]|nr:hypothetical protein BDV93DRAFT_557076 [Ceratobasidium sp. AG-I]
MKGVIAESWDMLANFASEAKGTKYLTSTNGRGLLNELIGNTGAMELLQDIDTIAKKSDECIPAFMKTQSNLIPPGPVGALLGPILIPLLGLLGTLMFLTTTM